MATANNLGTAYIRIAPQMQGIQSTIQSRLGGLGSSVGAQFSNNFTAKWGKAAGAIAGVTATVMSKALNAVTDSIDKAISRVDTLNAFPKIMKNLGFEAEESESSVSKLSDRIEGLPTTLDGIVTYTQRLASTTGNLNKGIYNATNLAIAFNDAALAGGKGQYEANRAFEQFVQVISRGRPSMQDWKIMMEVMPGQLKQLAKYMGSNNKSLKEYAKNAKKTVDQLDGMDLYSWISEDKNEHAKERLNELQKAMIDLDNKGGAGITSFKDQVGDATHTIGNAMSLIPVRISKALAKVIQAFGTDDIYTAIDKFTSKFGAIGDWIADNIVPIIRDEVLPVLKNVAVWVKNVIEWVAKTKEARGTLGNLLKAFIAFKVVAAVGSTILAVAKAFTTFIGVLKTVKLAWAGFTSALAAGSTVGGAFASASAASTGLTSKVMGVASAATGTIGPVSSLAATLSTLTIAAGAFVAAGMAVYATLETIADREKQAEIAARTHQRMIISSKNNIDALNKSMELQQELLDQVAAAKDAAVSAEKEYILSKQDVAIAQEELNRQEKAGKKGTDDYRLAQLNLEEAISKRTAAEKKLAEAKKEEQRSIQQEKDNHFTELNVQNRSAAAANLRAKNYAAVAKQLDELSKKTYTYKKANGELLQASKEDMESAVDYISLQLAREDSVWKEIRENAAKNGTSFVEEVKKYGETGAQRFMGNFATGVTKYKPLVTEAIEGEGGLRDSLSSMLGRLASSAKEMGFDTGSNLISGLKNGLNSARSGLLDVAKKAMQAVTNTMDNVAKIKSPSRVTMKTGRYLAEGIQVGMEDYLGKLEATARNVMSSTINSLDGDVNPALGAAPAYGNSAQSARVPAQVVQNNTFNQVADDLDVKEASRQLGWQVATAI